MNKLPYTEEQGMQLVNDGHLSHDTFKHIKLSNGFTQRLADGGEVEPEEAPAEAPQPTINNGDIHPIDALVNGLNSGGSQEAYDQSMASLPKTNDGADQEPIPGGVQVASNDPNADRQIASGMVQPEPQAKPAEGSVPTPMLAQPAQPAQDPLQGQAGDDIKKITGGMDQESKGLKDSFEQGEKQAHETAGFLHGMRVHAQNAQAVEQVKEEERQSFANEQYQKVQKAADDAAQAAKIDPNNFWSSRTTGQKISGIVGLILGGVGGGLSGHGGNVALDILNKAIDRDIDAQKFNAEQKGRNFNTQVGLYNVMRQKFGDERQAYAATQLSYLQSAEMQIRETAAKYQSPEMQARAQIALGQLAQRQGMLSQQIHASAYQAAAMHQLMNGGQVGAAGLAALSKEVQDRLVPLNGGMNHGVAYGPKGGEEGRAVSTAADKVRSTLARMRQLRDEGPRILPYGTLKARAESLQSELIPQINELSNLKRLTGEEIALHKKRIPDVGSWLKDKNDALMNNLEQSVHDSNEAYFKNNLMGYKPSHFTPKR